MVNNEEGCWALHDEVAVLFPHSRSKAGSGIVGTPWGFDWHLNPIGLDPLDPQLAGDIELTGERFQQEGRWLLRITVVYGEKSKIKLARMMKKRIPLFFRPFFKTDELKKLVDQAIPVRDELVIDPDTYIVISWRGYRSDGLLLSETQGWQPCPDLPTEQYSVPRDLAIIRPKSRNEAERLDSQIRDDK